MITKTQINNGIYFDAETTTEYKTYDLLPFNEKKEWDKRCSRRFSTLGLSNEELYIQKGPIDLDFNRIICISIGSYHLDSEIDNIQTIHSKDEDEKEILQKFKQVLENSNRRPLIGANIKGFDIPLICRKMWKHKIKLPPILRMYITAKPWEQGNMVIDLFDTWSFNSYQQKFPTFNSMCLTLGVDTPKEDIDGSEVYICFWNNEKPKVIRYCERDVKALIDCCLVIYNIEKED